MITKPAIIVENISKQYRIASKYQERSLREALVNLSKTPYRLAKSFTEGHFKNQPDKLFWALRDISFNINEGEILGIIGHNGAGKSTLLKILSRITEPTTGKIKIFGRIGSLLEVGTGFHSELTGRENIFLNGAILGMKKSEIKRKFDEIVEFSEVGEFLETPVKRYSSGMYVRLAFAVAAHLEPEILIVDEVLAVGDTAFQQKCLGKMNEVANSGRTILFVSHSMAAIQSLCTRAILLRNGEIIKNDRVEETIAAYLTLLETQSLKGVQSRTDRSGSGNIRFTKINFCIPDYPELPVLVTGKAVRFTFEYEGHARYGAQCSFTIYDQLGQPVTYFDTHMNSSKDLITTNNSREFICLIEELLLIPGRYHIDAAIYHDDVLEDHLKAAAFFDVEQGDIRGRIIKADKGYGNIIMPHKWIRQR